MKLTMVRQPPSDEVLLPELVDTLRRISVEHADSECLIVPCAWMDLVKGPKSGKLYGIYPLNRALDQMIVERGAQEGFVVVDCPHTTCGLFVQEDEKGVRQDAIRLLEELLPVDDGWYLHNEVDDRRNGRSHLGYTLLGIGQSRIFPIRGGKIPWGQFRSLLLFDLDPVERQRTVSVCVISFRKKA